MNHWFIILIVVPPKYLKKLLKHLLRQQTGLRSCGGFYFASLPYRRLAPTHVMSLQMFRIAVLGGSGNSLALVILMMRSKVEKYRALGRLSFIPGLCSINEPIIFWHANLLQSNSGDPLLNCTDHQCRFDLRSAESALDRDGLYRRSFLHSVLLPSLHELNGLAQCRL